MELLNWHPAIAESRIEIEAMVANRDIGFVRAGQDVEIKVDTFTFTKYGLIRGKVRSVSPDAIPRDAAQDRAGAKPSGDVGSEPKGQELVYSAAIVPDRTQMRVDDALVNLSPGMAVTVEIKTGARTVLTYLLSPILRYGHDTLRER